LSTSLSFSEPPARATPDAAPGDQVNGSVTLPAPEAETVQ
jgi:hypothetical protein